MMTTPFNIYLEWGRSVFLNVNRFQKFSTLKAGTKRIKGSVEQSVLWCARCFWTAY